MRTSRSRLPSATALLLAAAAASCDGDGCHGGPRGPATRFCQEQQEHMPNDAGAPAIEAMCRSCCLQEVSYRGEVEDGRCVCR